MLKVVFKHVRSAKFKSARIRTQIECWHWPLVLEVPGSVGMSNVLHRTDKVRLGLRKKNMEIQRRGPQFPHDALPRPNATWNDITKQRFLENMTKENCKRNALERSAAKLQGWID